MIMFISCSVPTLAVHDVQCEHENSVCTLLTRDACGLLSQAFMTVCDLIHMEHAQAWEKQDKGQGDMAKQSKAGVQMDFPRTKGSSI